MVTLLKFSDNSSSSPHTVGYNLNLNNLLSKSDLNKLKGENIMSKYSRRKVLNLVVDDIFENKTSTITEKYLFRVASHMVENYPKAFGCTDEDQYSEAAFSAPNSMVYHLRYLQRMNPIRSGNTPSKTHRKSQNYGLVEDLPRASEDEEQTVLENRRELLITMKKSNDFNQSVVLKLMKGAYIAVRQDINQGLNMEELLQKWPFIGNAKVFTDHFGRVCNRPVEPDLSFLSLWMEFFKYLSHQKRRGGKKEIPLELSKIIRNWDDKNETIIIIVILCILVHLEIPQEGIFLKFNETTSYDEVQASNLLPDNGQPVLALLGSEPGKSPKAYLIIEKRCTAEVPTSTAEGLIHLIMSYFIFKIPYQSRPAPLFDFIQRKILGIESGEGSKVARKRTEKGWGHASPEISKKYTMLVRDFNYFKQVYQS